MSENREQNEADRVFPEMLRKRHYIPCAMAILAFVIAGVLGSLEESVFSDRSEAEQGQFQKKFGPFKLQAGVHYDLHFRILGYGQPSGFLADISLGLETAEGDSVFEVEDGYWAESGIWREGGESGTWYEKNIVTKVYFVAPETTNYVVVAKGLQSRRKFIRYLMPGGELEIRKRWASTKPLYVTGVLLLVIALLSLVTRGFKIRKEIALAKAGDQLTFRRHKYRIEDVFDYTDHPDAPLPTNTMHNFGAELRLLDDKGNQRFLSLETHDHENSEGDDVNYDIMVWWRPLETDEIRRLGDSEAKYKGKSYERDFDKSGRWHGRSRSDRNLSESGFDEVYLEHYPMATLKLKKGDRMLTQSAAPDGEVEWTLGEVVTWKEIYIKTAKA